MRIAHLQFGIRDMLWLMLAIAAITGWTLEHRRISSRIAKSAWSHWGVREQRERVPSKASIKRISLVQSLSRWTDDKLAHSFTNLSATRSFTTGPDYDPYLSEMARRGLASELQSQYDKLMAEESDFFVDNYALLIALRRAQGKRDPLRMHVKLVHRQDGTAPWISATVENIDDEKAGILFVQGCDDRGGRREKWRIVLTDAKGTIVQDSNFEPMNGGGIGSLGPLEFGKMTMDHFLQMRYYVAPPRSGKYRLELVYHNSEGIASEGDLTGLIVIKSEPITVIVANPTDVEPSTPAVTGFIPWFSAMIAFGCLLIPNTYRFMVRRPIAMPKTRDICWCAVILAFSFGWWLDQVHLSNQVSSLTRDVDSDWTVQLVDDR